jgi:hypothetical protein
VRHNDYIVRGNFPSVSLCNFSENKHKHCEERKQAPQGGTSCITLMHTLESIHCRSITDTSYWYWSDNLFPSLSFSLPRSMHCLRYRSFILSRSLLIVPPGEPYSEEITCSREKLKWRCMFPSGTESHPPVGPQPVWLPCHMKTISLSGYLPMSHLLRIQIFAGRGNHFKIFTSPMIHIVKCHCIRFMF